MNIDENEFFRQITLRLCNDIKIENAMAACMAYLNSVMPADLLVLQYYQPELASNQLLASATTEMGSRLNVSLPYSHKARQMAGIRIDTYMKMPEVIINNHADQDPDFVPVVEFFNLGEASSLLLALEIGSSLVGSLVLFSKGRNRYTKAHADLFNVIKEPFSSAIYNTHALREVNRLTRILEDDNRFLQEELTRFSGDHIVGEEFGMKRVMDMVHQVAAHDSPVLLLGETGTGKDVIAKSIHDNSARKFGPFITVNCGSIPDSLIDSELFGHEKGAFTGALSQKRGRFERANKGTIFLDEVGDMPLQAQIRLLRVLQNKVIERVGNPTSINVNIRVIAATNKNLEEMVELNQFREDLWFRLNVFPINIPPLRERKEDIPALAQYFIRQKSQDLKLSSLPRLAENAIEQLEAYPWPGNVRELQNVIERALILNPGGPLKFDHIINNHQRENALAPIDSKDNTLHIEKVLAHHIQSVLKMTNGKIHGSGGAAELMGINPSTLRAKMKKMKIPYGRRRH